MTYNRCFYLWWGCDCWIWDPVVFHTQGRFAFYKSKKEEVDKQVILTTLIYDREKLGGYLNGNNARNVYRVLPFE